MSVTDELRLLYERDGHLEPEQVLAAAADRLSPLHDHFEWDDTEAAHHYRLQQAGSLIRRCKITVIGGGVQTHRVRAYVNVPSSDGVGMYLATEDALADPLTRDVVLSQAIRDFAAFRRKYQGLMDLDAFLRDQLMAVSP